MRASIETIRNLGFNCNRFDANCHPSSTRIPLTLNAFTVAAPVTEIIIAARPPVTDTARTGADNAGKARAGKRRGNVADGNAGRAKGSATAGSAQRVVLLAPRRTSCVLNLICSR
eukprot:1189429-Prorocentrum_minimum.AAC.3